MVSEIRGFKRHAVRLDVGGGGKRQVDIPPPGKRHKFWILRIAGNNRDIGFLFLQICGTHANLDFKRDIRIVFGKAGEHRHKIPRRKARSNGNPDLPLKPRAVLRHLVNQFLVRSDDRRDSFDGPEPLGGQFKGPRGAVNQFLAERIFQRSKSPADG